MLHCRIMRCATVAAGEDAAESHSYEIVSNRLSIVAAIGYLLQWRAHKPGQDRRSSDPRSLTDTRNPVVPDATAFAIA
jgi:hypothetical protein